MGRFIPFSAYGLAALTALLFASACAEKEYSVHTAQAPAAAQAPTPPAASAPPPEVVSLPSSTPVPQPPLPKPVSQRVRPVYRETGVASWYGRDFQGRKTASGDVFDMYQLSAAHRTLPLGTVIRVTNLDNSKSITVRVNDRGPFVANRILELSYAAARELGFVRQGTAHVSIEAQELPHSPSLYSIQAAVFTEEENANLLKDRLSQKYEHISVQRFETSKGTFYRVRVGSYGTEERAEAVAAKLKLEGLEPFVVRKD
jgi:rare lipoprotein A